MSSTSGKTFPPMQPIDENVCLADQYLNQTKKKKKDTKKDKKS